MFRRVRFECGVCAAGFVDWHDEEWERVPVFCVNCGEPIVAAGTPVDSEPEEPRRDDAIALGVLKGTGLGFPDTLRGLRAARPGSSPDIAPPRRYADGEAGAATERPGPPATEPPRPRRARLSRVGALLLGFAAGVPLTLYVQDPVWNWVHPSARAEAEQRSRLAAVAAALDDGNLSRARVLLDGIGLNATDRRAATLRARLTLSLILAKRPDEARRELSAIQNVSSLHPTPGEIQSAFDAVFAPSTLPATNSAPPVSSAKAAAKAPPSVATAPTRAELLAFARDRQRRSLLDDAQRMYEEVLRTRPNDSEARCGLAEIQLLRGSVDDARELFERALRSNEGYLPAWVALGDIDWLAGHLGRAVCRYQLVINRFPAGSYPPYLAARVARVMGSAESPTLAPVGDAGLHGCD